MTKNMTAEQHTKGRERLREAAAPEDGIKLHSCFGDDGQVPVFDVWESQIWPFSSVRPAENAGPTLENGGVRRVPDVPRSGQIGSSLR